MRAVILMVALTVPMVAGGEKLPGSWREQKGERVCEPVCRERRVALVGDSIMLGQWFADYLHDQFVQFNWYEWDDQFSEEDALTPGEYLPQMYVQNFSRKGAGVSGLNEEMWEALRGGFRPTHVVLYGGINDCAATKWHSSEDNAQYVIQALESMVEHVRQAGVEPILVQHHPWHRSKYDRKGQGWACSQIVNEWIEDEELRPDGVQFVRTLGMGSCDGYLECKCDDERCESRYEMDEDLTAGDGLHPNRLGQGVLAQMIQDQVDWECW